MIPVNVDFFHLCKLNAFFHCGDLWRHVIGEQQQSYVALQKSSFLFFYLINLNFTLWHCWNNNVYYFYDMKKLLFILIIKWNISLEFHNNITHTSMSISKYNDKYSYFCDRNGSLRFHLALGTSAFI